MTNFVPCIQSPPQCEVDIPLGSDLTYVRPVSRSIRVLACMTQSRRSAALIDREPSPVRLDFGFSVGSYLRARPSPSSLSDRTFGRPSMAFLAIPAGSHLCNSIGRWAADLIRNCSGIRSRIMGHRQGAPLRSQLSSTSGQLHEFTRIDCTVGWDPRLGMTSTDK